MNYTNSDFVFETLLRDYEFMNSIDDYILKNIKLNKTFYSKNVPQLVLIIITLLVNKKDYIDSENNINNDNELQQLLELFYTYSVKKIKETISILKYQDCFNIEEFKLLYDTCSRLVILKFKFKKKTGLFCIKKTK